MNSIDKQVKLTPDGPDFFYRENGAGPAMLLLHGNPGSHEDFNELLGALGSRGFTCMAPDRPGHGKNSGTPNQIGNIYTATRSYVDFIDKVTDGSVFVVGYSLGCYYALKLAYNFPNKVKGVALITPFIFGRNDEKPSSIPKLAKFPVIGHVLGALIPTLASKKMKQHFARVYDPVALDEKRLAELIALYCNSNETLAMMTDKNELIEQPIEPLKLKTLKCRCISIGAKKDAVVDSVAQGEKLKQNVRHALIENIADAGHGLIFSQAGAAGIAEVISKNIWPEEKKEEAANA